MSRGTNQKFKFTYLMKIMLAKTDDEHALTMPQIMEELEKFDVTAERKSIYADFQDMTDKFALRLSRNRLAGRLIIMLVPENLNWQRLSFLLMRFSHPSLLRRPNQEN